MSSPLSAGGCRAKRGVVLNEGLTLNDRTWLCMACGAAHDRDENAAINILAEAKRSMAPGAGVAVHGEGSAGATRKCRTPVGGAPHVKEGGRAV